MAEILARLYLKLRNNKIKKNKILSIFISFFVLVLPLESAYSSTLIKTGKSCKIQKQVIEYQNKTFTCIKSGKKLVWSKGVQVVTQVPKVDPFIAWSTKFKTESMIQSALNSTSSYFGNVTPNSSYEIIIDKMVNEYDRQWNTKMLDYANGSFSNIERDRVKVFLGRSHDWSIETLKNNNLWIGDPNSPIPCSRIDSDAYCADKNLILMVTIYNLSKIDAGRRAIPAHELFHTVQNALLGYDRTRLGPGHPRSIPRWLLEGSATYYGYYVVNKLNFDSYQNGRSLQLQNNYQNIFNKHLSEYDDYISDPYGIGQIATEYIVASVGFESLLNIFKFSGTEGSFAAGFKKATGIELNDFYLKFNEATTSLKNN